jgi:hypothetical protein
MYRVTYAFLLPAALILLGAPSVAQHTCDVGHMPVPSPLEMRALSVDYTCDPASCAPPDCLCASVDPPPSISPGDVPQFVVVSYDDCINPTSQAFIDDLQADLANPDGRSIPATYFLSVINCWEAGGVPSDAGLIRRLYENGNEIANHTFSHNVSSMASTTAWESELVLLENFLIEEVGIPREHITGFRAPWLATSDAMFHVLMDRGYTYDSSLMEQPFYDASLSSGPDGYVWPHTLDYGAAVSCGFFPGNECPSKQLSGLWTIPLYFMTDPRGTEAPADSVYYGAFDPGADLSGGPILTGQKLYDLLWWNFEQRVQGNRAPFTLAFHASQLQDEARRETLNRFMGDILQVEGVWAVTMNGLIEWLKDPAPASQMAAWYSEYCERYPCGQFVAEEPSLGEPFEVGAYPNPTRGNLTFRLGTPAVESFEVAVYDALGRRVLNQYQTAAGEREIHLDLSAVVAGVYVYRLRVDDQLVSGRVTLVP